MLECLHLSLPRLMAESGDWLENVAGYACFSGQADSRSLHGQDEQDLQDESPGNPENPVHPVKAKGDEAVSRFASPIPSIRVNAPVLSSEEESACEIWRATGPFNQGQRGALAYRHNADILFGCLDLKESDFPDAPDSSPLRNAARFAYREIFETLDDLGFPYLYRVWNYIPDINLETHGLERYRQFNVGRQDGFIAQARDIAGAVPAASALGSTGAALQICFLAGRFAPTPIENPRQLSAYRYPPEYGPRSPTFSRASLARMGEDEILFISGTASIVGHASVHLDDPAAQTRESLANIGALLQATERQGRASFDPANLLYKVYIRRAEDIWAIREEMESRLGENADVVFLLADICRRDLLLEIEATGCARASPPTRPKAAYILGKL
jgi:enamine deaminase RidA (YjgF/YER057c/UK114 family)